MIIAILLLASPVSAFFSFGFSMSQSRAVAGATVASEIIADTMVSNYIDENHPEYSDEYTVVSLIFDPTGKIIGKLSSKGVKYANGIYEYSKKSNKGKDIVDSDTLNKIFDKELIEELAKKENKGYSSKTVAKNTVELLEEGVEPENINKLFKDAVKEDKKLGWMDNRIKNLKDDGIKTSTINNIIKNSNKPNDALKKVAGETNKLSKMGISKSSIFRITKNANNVDDITKQRKIIGDLKKRRISKEAINKLIEKGQDLEKAKEVVKELRNKGVPAKVIDDLIKKDVSLDVIKNYEEMGIDLNKLNYALDKLKGVRGYDRLLESIKCGNTGATYEAIVAAEKCNVDEIVELSKKLDKKTYGYETEIDIETTNKIIECKGKDIVKDGSRKWQRFVEQLRKLSDYSKTHDKELVYCFREQPNDDVIRKLNEFGAKYVVYKP